MYYSLLLRFVKLVLLLCACLLALCSSPVDSLGRISISSAYFSDSLYEGLVIDSADEASLERSLRELVQKTNTGIPYKDDSICWDMEDFWATPKEMFGRKCGDCEDLAVSQYLYLLYQGHTNVMLGYGINEESVAHVVVLVYREGSPHPYVLDINDPKFSRLDKRPDLPILFIFNEVEFIETENSAMFSTQTLLDYRRHVLLHRAGLFRKLRQELGARRPAMGAFLWR